MGILAILKQSDGNNDFRYELQICYYLYYECQMYYSMKLELQIYYDMKYKHYYDMKYKMYMNYDIITSCRCIAI